MSNLKLRECPFCGSDKLTVGYPIEFINIKHVMCKCGCHMPVRLWNNRPYENKLKAEAVREAADKILATLQEQYTTPDAQFLRSVRNAEFIRGQTRGR